MEEQYVINKALYNKLKEEIIDNNVDCGCDIVVYTDSEYVRFVNEDMGNSITVFSKPNSMRYIAYTVDSLMSEIIGKFGYQSVLHHRVDKVLREIGYIKT